MGCPAAGGRVNGRGVSSAALTEQGDKASLLEIAIEAGSERGRRRDPQARPARTSVVRVRATLRRVRTESLQGKALLIASVDAWLD